MLFDKAENRFLQYLRLFDTRQASGIFNGSELWHYFLFKYRKIQFRRHPEAEYPMCSYPLFRLLLVYPAGRPG